MVLDEQAAQKLGGRLTEGVAFALGYFQETPTGALVKVSGPEGATHGLTATGKVVRLRLAEVSVDPRQVMPK